MTETAITVYGKIENPVSAIQELGVILAQSGMFGTDKNQQGCVLAMQCLSEGITPLDLARRYHIIQGKLSMRADAMMGEFHNRGGKTEWIQFDDKAAICLFTPPGGKGKQISFTEEDAKHAGYLPAKAGSGWAKTPDAMLRARCISKAIRMLMPEVVAGMYTPEEVADFDSPKTTAQPQYTPKPVTTVTSTTHSKESEHKETMAETLTDVIDATTEDPKASEKVEGISLNKRQFLNSLFGKIGIKDRTSMSKYVMDKIGVSIKTLAELDTNQASDLITILKSETGQKEAE